MPCFAQVFYECLSKQQNGLALKLDTDERLKFIISNHLEKTTPSNLLLSLLDGAVFCYFKRT